MTAQQALELDWRSPMQFFNFKKKTFWSILDAPKTFRPFRKGRSVANELQFVV
jgi:hypothetical protein